MVKMTTNMGVGVRKNFFEIKANSLLALNITGSLAAAARYKAVKNYIFLVRSRPYIVKAWDLPEILLLP